MQEKDDSGIFRTKYNVLHNNDTHAHLHRTWTNHDYQQFADGTPVKGTHKVQSRHSAHVHLKDGKVEQVHRSMKAFFKPPNGHPRAENLDNFENQDIEVSASGYSKLRLKSCSDPYHPRSKRSVTEKEHLDILKTLTKDSILFNDNEKVSWSDVGGNDMKTRPLYELLRCLVGKTVQKRELAYCVTDLHRLIRNDKSALKAITKLVQNRNHQNLTSWSVCVSALAAHGKYEAQNALADAVDPSKPRSLSFEEYESLLVAIYYLPTGPLHSNLFDALLKLAFDYTKEESITATAMMVLAGLSERARKAGYNETLSKSVVNVIFDRYKNKSTIYHPDSVDYEMQLRDHIWAFGNLGHHSGLPVILDHLDHDDSSIRSAVISAMRKMPQEFTDHHLIKVLHHDEQSDVKAAVVSVFIERHQNLSDIVVEGLEHAMWHAKEGEALDSAIRVFLENHGNHSKAKYLRIRRRLINRRKRALIPALRPREFNLGHSKHWGMIVGGEWLGAETAVDFSNKLSLRIGIFDGKVEVNLDNSALFQGHILKHSFDIGRGKATFRASASFKNDIPKDLIHTVVDAGDDLSRQFDSITSVITKHIEEFRKKLEGVIPLSVDEFTEFVNSIEIFLQNLKLPLQAVKSTRKVVSYSKEMRAHVNRWKSLKEKNSKIQRNLVEIRSFDVPFKKALDTLDWGLGVAIGVRKYLPNNLPKGFSINKLLHILWKTSASQQKAKIKEYFLMLGSSVPDEFISHLPFTLTHQFSFSLEKFQEVLNRFQRFSSNVLHMSYLLDSFKDVTLPVLKLRFLKRRAPALLQNRCNFGLTFDWRISLKFNLQLNSTDFRKLAAILGNAADFFDLFTNATFDLEEFFREILPGGKYDLEIYFPDLLRKEESKKINHFDSAGVLQAFLLALTTQFNSHMSNVSDISAIINFFQELGPAITQFLEGSIQKTCGIRKSVLDFFNEHKNFQREGISDLKEVEEAAKMALKELHNFTMLVENLVDKVESNFTVIAKELLSASMQELTVKMAFIKDLANNISTFTNGTQSGVSGSCTKASRFSVDVIDEVQASVRQTLKELKSFTGPVASKMKTAGTNVRLAVTNVEAWYQENMAGRDGKISRVAQILSDFLSVLGTKKGFVNNVEEIASSINKAFKHLKKIPQFTSKTRKTVNEVIHFADRAQEYTDEIRKLDLRKQFGTDFDKAITRTCSEFQNIATKTLKKLRHLDVGKEVNSIFKQESNIFIYRASSNLRAVIVSVSEIQMEVKKIRSIITEFSAVLRDLKPFNKNLLPLSAILQKLPDCKEIEKTILDNNRFCVHKAQVFGRTLLHQYKDLKAEIEVLNNLVSDVWKNFKIQKCLNGGSCISKVFIEQGKVVKKKANSIKVKLDEVSGYSESLKTCEENVDTITAVFHVIKLIAEEVRNLTNRDSFQRVRALLQKTAGRKPGKSENYRQKRDLKNEKAANDLISDYIKKARTTNIKLQAFQESTFHTLRSVHDDAIDRHAKTLVTLRSRLQLSYQLWQKSRNVDKALRTLEIACENAIRFAEKFDQVASLVANPTISLLTGTEEITERVKPFLDQYKSEASEAVAKVNGLVDKTSDFLNKIQTRQRGLHPSEYKRWQSIHYCSKDVCLRSIRRSSNLYLSTIFRWKFPHLDDLSSMPKAGRWLTPGLFDDYKVQGISELSNNQMVLGMYGVSSNEEKASLLVVTNFGGGVKKIVQLFKQGHPLPVKIGGVALARNYIWVSNYKSNEIISIKKSLFQSTLTSAKPSRIDISKREIVKGTATSVSYDTLSNILWITSDEEGKAYGYKLSANGDMPSSGLALYRVIYIGKNVKGMIIVRQSGGEYACISRCALIAGFQCRLEFHDLNGGDTTSENTLARVVRTPSGLESVTRIDNEVIAVAFSSGTLAEKENVELTGGDYEDRYFKLRLPILKTMLAINENCLYFRLLGDNILRPRKIFPIGDVKCGSKRKRSIFEQLMESDVYHERLEEIHHSTIRIRRSLADVAYCKSIMEATLLSNSVTFFSVELTISVFGIPISFFAGASGHYSVGYKAELCMKSKMIKLGLIPGAWVRAYAGASLSLVLIKVGVTVEARLLETYLVPTLSVEVSQWPVQACIELKLAMTPLSIRVYLWYRFRSVEVDAWIIGIDISFGWGRERVFQEWTWSKQQIELTMFTNCERKKDMTRPKVGRCKAQQIADKTYFVQWHGFHEDTMIKSYFVNIGSIKGSGDDFSTWAGISRSLVVKELSIMHTRNVFISVMATNEEGMDSSLAYCSLFQARRKSPQIRFVRDGTIQEKDVDYQSDTHSLAVNYAFKSDLSEVVNLKWGVSSQALCTFDESETNVAPLSSLGDYSSIQVSGLSLQHGKKYFTRVYAMNQVGLKAVMCSDGVLIDITPPIPVSFQDGTGDVDAQFIPSVSRARGKFQPFNDPESPMIEYEWKIKANMSGNFKDITPFVRIPLTQQEPLMEGLSLTPGTLYRLVLRGTNAAGLQSIIETNGFKPDVTPPFCEGNVVDVTNETDTDDVDVAGDLEIIQAKWKCFDRESGINSQSLGIGTYPGGDNLKAFEDVTFFSQTIEKSEMFYVKFYNVTILPKVRYHVTVRIINGAGLRKTITSDGILVDITPPTVASYYIKDGESGKDRNFTSERFTFTAHWEQAFTDAESGVVEYRAGLGTKPGVADVKALHVLGSQTNVTVSGLLLESGQVYYMTVVGCNGVGMCVNASSNGMTVDFVPPNPGKVITGLKGPPVLYQWISKSVWARWKWCSADERRSQILLNSSRCSEDSFYDIHSGISMFSISVISQENKKLLSPFRPVGTQSYSGRSISMDDGVYSVAIEATDKAGITSQGFSNTFIVDSSPPLITLVQHGYFGETVEFVNTTVIKFRSYFILEDDLSVITACKIGVGTYSGADDVVKFQTFYLRKHTSTLRANWTSSVPTTLENHRRYFITVLARNSAGLLTIKSSFPILSDFEAPKYGLVMDGWGPSDTEYQSFSSLYRAHWYGFTDFSGIETTYLGLSSKAGGSCDVKQEELVPSNSVAYVLFGLSLASGKKYYACLKLVDRAGNVAYFHSNGVVVDSSPPLTGFVNDGPLDQDVDVQTDSSVLRASWANFSENETTIASYHLAFGSAPGAQDIQDFTNVGLVNTSPSSRLKVQELINGERYYATVIAYNILGIPSSMVSSNGVLVDFTPPIFSQPTRDGEDPISDRNYTSQSYLKATWTCLDPETNVSSIEIAFGLQPGQTDVVNFTSLSVSQTSFIIGHKLKLGYRYFATVRCTNKLGLAVVSVSNGIVYDDTPPTLVYLKDGDYQSSNRTLLITLKFVDAESGVHAYKAQVWTHSAGSSLESYGSFTIPVNVTSATLQLYKELITGTTYYVNVTAVNGVGLEATQQSDGFIVDMTPPACSKVWDGNADSEDEQEFATSSSQLKISWVCYDNESSITQYRFAVKEVYKSEYLFPFHALKSRVNPSGSAVITGEGRTTREILKGHIYSSGIEIENSVGMKTVYWTNGVTIDNTSPLLFGLHLTLFSQRELLTADWSVSDEESGLKSLSWGLGTTPEANDIRNYTVISPINTKVSVLTFSFPQGITCFLNLLAINNAGLSSRSSSNAVIIDRSAPDPGVVAAYYAFPPNYDRSKNKVPNSTLAVSWTGFADLESGIKMTSWAVGTNLLKLKRADSARYTKVVPKESIGGVIIRNQTLWGNSTYFVCVRVTNGVGLHKTDCSTGMLIILGQLSAGVVSDGPITSADDIDFQLDDKAIWAHWDGFEDPVYDIQGYNWCIRDHPPSFPGSDICKWTFTEVAHLKTSASRFHNLTLLHGNKYFVTVKAENTRGNTIMSSSDGVVIDRTPPIGKAIKISPSSGKDTLFITSQSAPIVTWSIDDPESGISHFTIAIGSLPFQDDLLSIQHVDRLSHSIDLNLANFTVHEGLSFFVTVTGVNMLGLETSLVSLEVVMDWSPPSVGSIIEGKLTDQLSQALNHSDDQREEATLFCHWSRFQDSESDVMEYRWCLGTSQGRNCI